jgi:hypothetical protein
MHSTAEIHPLALRLAENVRAFIRNAFTIHFLGVHITNVTRDKLARVLAQELRIDQLEATLEKARSEASGTVRDRIDAALALIKA